MDGEVRKISCCGKNSPDSDNGFPLASVRPPLRLPRDPQCGYDCEFQDATPTLIQATCSVCLLILRQPHLISCCGQNYCQQCIQKVLGQHKPCPLCNMEPFTTLHNKGLERALADLKVTCVSREQGCEWVGELRSYEKHLNLDPELENQLTGCKYVRLECAYKCGSWFLRGAIARHQKEKCPQRPYCCDYCRDYNSVHANVVYRHWPVCRCYPMECPNHCSAYAIERQNLQDHLDTECPLKMLECEFHPAGCDVLVARQDMSQHLEEFHLQHTSLLGGAHQKLMDETAERDEVRRRLADQKEAELAVFREECQGRLDRVWVENAFLKQEMVSMRSEMAEMRKEFLESVSQLKTSHAQREVESGRVREDLQAQVTGLRCELEKTRTALAQQCYSIQTRVGVFPVEFTMEGFSQHNGEWQSPSFYSHLEGYRLCLVISPKGEGRDNEACVNVFVCVMRGEYDHQLNWPLLAEFTVQLRNQLTDRHHATEVIKFTETTPTSYSSRVVGRERGKEGWGLKGFIGHSELVHNSVKNRQFLKDDRLCFRITRVELL